MNLNMSNFGGKNSQSSICNNLNLKCALGKKVFKARTVKYLFKIYFGGCRYEQGLLKKFFPTTLAATGGSCSL